jgi:Dolichyl-phosphate-mannose-protein mannosyltransferase
MIAAERFFAPAVALLLAVFAALLVTTALGENQSFDEHTHLASGYAEWKAGDYAFEMDHPALAKMIAAAPLLFLNLTIDKQSRGWKEYRVDDFGIDFLYRNRLSPEQILFAGRAPMMVLAILLGFVLAWWVRKKLGAPAALAVLAFYCLDPNIVAHSRYVATDMPLVVFFVLTALAGVTYLETGKPRHLLLVSLLFALTMVTKYSGVVLAPALLLLYVVGWWQKPAEFPVRRLLLALAAFVGVTLAVIVVVYWPDTVRCLRGRAESFAEWGDTRMLVGRALRFMGTWLHLPTHTYPFGLMMLADHNRYGHDGYLLGRHSRYGWWYYFPVAFAVKSTMAALLATLAVAAAGVGLLLRGSIWGRVRGAPLAWYGLLLPPILFFGAAMTSTINIGIRHVLVIYPFIYVLAAAVLARSSWRFARVLLAGLLVLQAAECASIYPHYLAFFNVLSGGPGKGPRRLVDSNIDWGQDVKKLARWLEAHGTKRVYFSYFGRDQVAHEGLERLDVPGTLDLAGRAAVDGYIAASVTHLMGVYIPVEELAWLRELKPVAKIGYSIYVYDLRKTRLALEQLGAGYRPAINDVSTGHVGLIGVYEIIVVALRTLACQRLDPRKVACFAVVTERWLERPRYAQSHGGRMLRSRQGLHDRLVVGVVFP